MRSLPPMIWMLGVFGILAVATILYSRTGLIPLPEARSAWAEAAEIRQFLEDRREIIEPKREKLWDRWPYQIAIVRLKNLEVPESVGRYVFRARPHPDLVPDPSLSFTCGLDLAWIDLRPGSPLGDFQLVAMREPEVKNIEARSMQ